jgi:methylated-DNA-[protein]-cysteine S-methyltransferase
LEIKLNIIGSQILIKLNKGSKMILKGTKFQIEVWNQIKKIPKGSVKTYKEIALILNKPKSSRAVANACGKNPYPPKIPCHRVIRSDGFLGGYSGVGGIKTKQELLISEGYSDFKIK